MICLALVSRFLLAEQLGARHGLGFLLLAAGMTLLLKEKQEGASWPRDVDTPVSGARACHAQDKVKE